MNGQSFADWSRRFSGLSFSLSAKRSGLACSGSQARFPYGTLLVNPPRVFLDRLAHIAGFTPPKYYGSLKILPLVIEIVDTSEKIEAFLPLIDDAIKEGLATLGKVHIRFYRSGDKPESGD